MGRLWQKNVKDFYGHSKVKAISPDELLQIVEKQ